MSNTLWTRYATIFLGVWLVIAPLTFAYNSALMQGNDIIAGLLLILFGAYTVTERHAWAAWAAALVGIWLQLAPLVFWAPDSFLYLNDTIIGVLAVCFAILIAL